MNGPGKLRTLYMTLGTVVVMGALAWASVPFYTWFCRVTGFGGTPLVNSEGASEILDEVVTIRFDASKEKDMPWSFKPVVRQMDVKIGETGLAFYEAHNPTDRPIAGTASYNVAPYAAGGYFTKIDCFCFELQVLEPGQTVQMPVTFYVDPEIVEDREGKYVHTITLSYTFYETELPEDQVRLNEDLQWGSETGTRNEG